MTTTRRISFADQDQFGSTTSSIGANEALSPAPAKKKRVRIKTERRREQCRRNQARYRDKQRIAAIELEDNVEELRRHVQQLRIQHETLRNRINVRESVVRTTIEHFRLFRWGLSTDHASAPFGSPTMDQQLAFVESVFHEDVRIDEAQGRIFFVEQTRRFRTFYDDFELTLERCEALPTAELSTSLVLTIRVDITISLLTIHYVFPHLLRGEHRELRWKLLGCRIQCPSSGVISFDAQSRIVGIRWELNLVAGLQAVLSLEEVAIVLQHAQIARDAYLLESGDEIRPTQEAVQRLYI